MPLLKMQFQTKESTSLNNFNQLQKILNKQVILNLQTSKPRRLNTTPALTGLVSRIQNLPKGGCKSCGR